MRGQPSDRYAVIIDIVAVDSRRYRYAYHRSSWLVAGKADPPPPARLYCHPDTPVSADALRKQVISFEKVKLTNNEMDKNGQVGVTKYSIVLQYFEKVTRTSNNLIILNLKISNFLNI
jgi:T-box protein 20